MSTTISLPINYDNVDSTSAVDAILLDLASQGQMITQKGLNRHDPNNAKQIQIDDRNLSAIENNIRVAFARSAYLKTHPVRAGPIIIVADTDKKVRDGQSVVISSLESELAASRAALLTAENAAIASEKEADHTRISLRFAEKAINEARAKAQLAETNLASANNEMAKLQNAMRASGNAQVSELVTQIAQSKNKEAELNAALTEANTQVLESQRRMRAAEQEAATAKKNLDASNALLRKATSDLATTQGALALASASRSEEVARAVRDKNTEIELKTVELERERVKTQLLERTLAAKGTGADTTTVVALQTAVGDLQKLADDNGKLAIERGVAIQNQDMIIARLNKALEAAGKGGGGGGGGGGGNNDDDDPNPVPIPVPVQKTPDTVIVSSDIRIKVAKTLELLSWVPANDKDATLTLSIEDILASVKSPYKPTVEGGETQILIIPYSSAGIVGLFAPILAAFFDDLFKHNYSVVRSVGPWSNFIVPLFNATADALVAQPASPVKEECLTTLYELARFAYLKMATGRESSMAGVNTGRTQADDEAAKGRDLFSFEFDVSRDDNNVTKNFQLNFDDSNVPVGMRNTRADKKKGLFTPLVNALVPSTTAKSLFDAAAKSGDDDIGFVMDAGASLSDRAGMTIVFAKLLGSSSGEFIDSFYPDNIDFSKKVDGGKIVTDIIANQDVESGQAFPFSKNVAFGIAVGEIKSHADAYTATTTDDKAKTALMPMIAFGFMFPYKFADEPTPNTLLNLLGVRPVARNGTAVMTINSAGKPVLIVQAQAFDFFSKSLSSAIKSSKDAAELSDFIQAANIEQPGDPFKRSLFKILDEKKGENKYIVFVPRNSAVTNVRAKGSRAGVPRLIAAYTLVLPKGAKFDISKPMNSKEYPTLTRDVRLRIRSYGTVNGVITLNVATNEGQTGEMVISATSRKASNGQFYIADSLVPIGSGNNGLPEQVEDNGNNSGGGDTGGSNGGNANNGGNNGGNANNGGNGGNANSGGNTGNANNGSTKFTLPPAPPTVANPATATAKAYGKYANQTKQATWHHGGSHSMHSAVKATDQTSTTEDVMRFLAETKSTNEVREEINEPNIYTLVLLLPNKRFWLMFQSLPRAETVHLALTHIVREDVLTIALDRCRTYEEDTDVMTLSGSIIHMKCKKSEYKIGDLLVDEIDPEQIVEVQPPGFKRPFSVMRIELPVNQVTVFPQPNLPMQGQSQNSPQMPTHGQIQGHGQQGQQGQQGMPMQHQGQGQSSMQNTQMQGHGQQGQGQQGQQNMSMQGQSQNQGQNPMQNQGQDQSWMQGQRQETTPSTHHNMTTNSSCHNGAPDKSREMSVDKQSAALRLRVIDMIEMVGLGEMLTSVIKGGAQSQADGEPAFAILLPPADMLNDAAQKISREQLTETVGFHVVSAHRLHDALETCKMKKEHHVDVITAGSTQLRLFCADVDAASKVSGAIYPNDFDWGSFVPMPITISGSVQVRVYPINRILSPPSQTMIKNTIMQESTPNAMTFQNGMSSDAKWSLYDRLKAAVQPGKADVTFRAENNKAVARLQNAATAEEARKAIKDLVRAFEGLGGSDGLRKTSFTPEEWRQLHMGRRNALNMNTNIESSDRMQLQRELDMLSNRFG
jgi:hypothetical protein